METDEVSGHFFQSWTINNNSDVRDRQNFGEHVQWFKWNFT